MCLSKDVAGTLFPILILFDPSTTSSFFCLRSVSVQRRDRYSVSFSCYFASPFLFSAALYWLHSVSVQRRDRCSATYTTHHFSVLLSRAPFPPLFWLRFSYFLCEPIEVTPPSLPSLSLFGFSLPVLRVYLSKDAAGTPPSPLSSRVTCHTPHTQPFPCENTKPECLNTSRLNRLLQNVSVHLD